MVQPAQVAPLVSSTRHPMTRSLLELAAIRAAVALPSIVGLTDMEGCQAALATQLVDNEIAHPWRMAEN